MAKRKAHKLIIKKKRKEKKRKELGLPLLETCGWLYTTTTNNELLVIKYVEREEEVKGQWMEALRQ